MPPSAKRGRAPRRTTVDQHVPSDEAEDPSTIATPSRSSRKRARDTTGTIPSAQRAAVRRKLKANDDDANDTDGTEAQEQSDADTEPSAPNEADVISKLRVADKYIHAASDFANDLFAGVENVPGYGKIAGRDWTYIIKQVEVNIGRPEQLEKAEQPDAPQSRDINALSHKSNINIDLGPDRQTSRLHATIAYDSAQEQWYIIVGGRNGLRLDSYLLKRGTKALLRSGSVIDIGGTQMAFITTRTRDNEGPIFADPILRQIYSDEDDPDADRHTGVRPPLPPPVRAPQLPPPGHSDDQPLPSSIRVHPHSQATVQNTSFATPDTPIRQQQPLGSGSRPSPASNGAHFFAGATMEPAESIDYAADSAKDLKPPHSYAQLIGMAILSTGEQQMTLNNIYKWIMANYAFYRFNTGGWQNSIRHNLSLNKAFEKIARRTDEPGKGMKWIISPKERDTFLSQGMKGCRRPNSLADPSSPTHAAPRKGNAVSEERQSVYSSSHPTAMEAFTPDRGSGRRPIHDLDDNGPDLSYYPPSVKGTLNHLTAAANAAGSPGPLYVKEEGRTGLLDTPFPMRSSQKLMPPSTLQQPSAFMEFSSPAPFWKFGSTPLRPLADMSPVKTPFSTFRPLGHHDVDVVVKPTVSSAREDTAILQSSSPPPQLAVGGGDASPSRISSRPVTSHGRHGSMAEPSPLHQVDSVMNKSISERGSGSRNSIALASPTTTESKTPTLSDVRTLDSMSVGTTATGHGQATDDNSAKGNASSLFASSRAPAPAPNVSMPRFDVEDEGGIDLMKGFQPIGSFHKLGGSRFSVGMAGNAAPGAVGR